jgi:ABC-type cobalamin transport system permease subunit
MAISSSPLIVVLLIIAAQSKHLDSKKELLVIELDLGVICSEFMLVATVADS